MEAGSPTLCKRLSEEENSNSPKKAKIVYRNDEESHFYLLFKTILNIFKERGKLSEEEISHGLESIIQSFKWKEGNRFSDVDLSRLDVLCGYLYRYASHGAGLARTRTMDALSNCDSLKKKLQKSELNIVSIGGGPGNDIIGFCSALYDFDCRSDLNITITDSVQKFASCVNLLEFLIREDDYGNVSKLLRECSVSMSFMQLELPDCRSRKCLQTLREADIIVMSKLFSILCEIKKERLIECLDKEVNPGTLILYIDSPFHPELWKDFDVLYRSNCEDYVTSNVTHRFGSNDGISSKAQIVVLRKRFLFIRSC